MKRSLFVMVLVVLLAVVFCVSCKNEPNNTGKVRDSWSLSYTETEKKDDGTYTITYTMLLTFYTNGKVSAITNIDTILLDGVDITEETDETVGTTTVKNGSYTATSESKGTVTLSYYDSATEKDVTEEGVYAISGNKLMLSVDGKSQMFTKK